MSPRNGASYVSDSPESAWDDGFDRPTQYRTGNSGQTPVPTRRRAKRTEPGLYGWAAVLLLIIISGIGGLIDQITGSNVRGAFSWALVISSLIAILVVKRSQMFGVVIAPPLVYFAASAAKLLLAGGLHNRKVLIDAASSWLVYGFPAIAGATAIVLVIAGIRMMIRR